MSLSRARELRNEATRAERALWAILRTFREQGYHFRRQVPIGPYYADIACHHARLVIEADGATHSTDEEIAHDRRRDRYFRSRGFRIIRVWNNEIVENAEGVLQVIAEALADVPALTPSPVPSPSHGKPRKRRLRSGLKELAARTGEPGSSRPKGAGG